LRADQIAILEKKFLERRLLEAAGLPRVSLLGVPDLKFINRPIAIADVARELDLSIGDNGNIHCWHPSVKCFGCGTGPLSVVDLVMAVLDLKNPMPGIAWIDLTLSPE
jgi:hypothetical protein